MEIQVYDDFFGEEIFSVMHAQNQWEIEGNTGIQHRYTTLLSKRNLFHNMKSASVGDRGKHRYKTLLSRKKYLM